MSLINDLIKHGYLRSPKIIEAFRKINRQDFILKKDLYNAELDAPLSIGYGQTISQPATVAFMLELLQAAPGEKILDIGSGSGWTVALLAQIAASGGKVYGLERIKELVDFAKDNISKYNFIKSGVARIICADGYKGLPEFAPFDKILVSAAAEEIPERLIKQLKIGGRLVMPLGKNHQTQSIVAVQKSYTEELLIDSYPGFVFVPLVKN